MIHHLLNHNIYVIYYTTTLYYVIYSADLITSSPTANEELTEYQTRRNNCENGFIEIA